MLRLVCRLTDDTALLPRMAEYAAGRMLRENAVPAYDPKSDSAFLWMELDGGSDDAELRRVFEDFADSCEWWRDRLGSQGDAADAPVPPEMMIRP